MSKPNLLNTLQTVREHQEVYGGLAVSHENGPQREAILRAAETLGLVAEYYYSATDRVFRLTPAGLDVLRKLDPGQACGNVQCDECEEAPATRIVLVTDLDGVLLERVPVCLDCLIDCGFSSFFVEPRNAKPVCGDGSACGCEGCPCEPQDGDDS